MDGKSVVTRQEEEEAKLSPFHALLVLGKNRLSILACCMTNLSEFLIVFSTSALIRLNTPSQFYDCCIFGMDPRQWRHTP